MLKGVKRQIKIKILPVFLSRYKVEETALVSQKTYPMHEDGFVIEEEGSLLKYTSDEGEIFLRKLGSDKNVFKQVFLDEEYQILIDLMVINNINPSVIVDGGSNIGLASFKFKKAFPDCKVFAFEPDPENFVQVQKNLIQFPDCILLNKAIWNKDEVLYLDFGFRDGEEWSRSVSQSNTSNIPVEAISINSLIDQYAIESIDLLKIDVEGSEAEIFGAGSNVSFLDKTKILAVEIHDERNCRTDIYKVLKEKNFILFNSNELTIGLNRNFFLKNN